MSLARTLLSGVSESMTIDTSEYNYEGSSESYYIDAAMESLVSDIYKVDKEYHVADIIGEVQVIKEGADGAVILEGMIKTGIEKLKNAFKKFWAKIQAWFAKVIHYFKSFFLKGKAFVKEFGKELRNKKADGFKYTGYKYTQDKGDALVSNVMDKVSKKITDAAGGIAAAKDEAKREYKNIQGGVEKASAGMSKDSIEKIETGDELIEAVLKSTSISGDSVTEMNEEIVRAYRDGEDEASEIEEFEANNVEDMIKVISNEKLVSDVEKEKTNFEKDVNAIIKALDKIKENGEVGEDLAYKLAQKYSQQASTLLNIGKSALNTKISVYKSMNNSFQSVLASFARFKPKAEGKDMEDLDDVDLSGETSDGLKVEESVLAMAMRLI